MLSKAALEDLLAAMKPRRDDGDDDSVNVLTQHDAAPQ